MKTLNPKTDGVSAAFKELQDDEMATRLVEVPGKDNKTEKYNIMQESASTLWFVKSNKGSLPEALSGKFTSVFEAEKAIQAYISKRDGLKLGA